MKNLINCGTCGYPLTPEERTTLVEKDGVMVKPAPVQEPVPDFKAFTAWANDAGYDTAYTHDGIKWICLNPMTADLWKAWQAATPPAQHPWVGLTDAEILADDTLRHYFGLNGGAGPVSDKGEKIIALIEAKLKEKNT